MREKWEASTLPRDGVSSSRPLNKAGECVGGLTEWLAASPSSTYGDPLARSPGPAGFVGKGCISSSKLANLAEQLGWHKGSAEFWRASCGNGRRGASTGSVRGTVSQPAKSISGRSSSSMVSSSGRLSRMDHLLLHGHVAGQGVNGALGCIGAQGGQVALCGQCAGTGRRGAMVLPATPGQGQ
jgi:hypothetical protein